MISEYRTSVEFKLSYFLLSRKKEKTGEYRTSVEFKLFFSFFFAFSLSCEYRTSVEFKLQDFNEGFKLIIV